MTPEQAVPVALQTYEMLGPALVESDQAAGGVGLALLNAILTPLQPVDDIVADLPDQADGFSPGWSRELDPRTTSRPGWAMQFTGDTPPPGLTVSELRARFDDRPHQRRGRPASLIASARPLLTGTRFVQVFERDGSAYRVRVRTYAEETPDPAAVNAALQAAKPGGLLLEHEVVTVTSYAAIEAEEPESYDAYEAGPVESYSSQEV